MGRRRKRERHSAARLRDQSGALPVPGSGSERLKSAPHRSAAGDKPYTDAAWRKAERRRILLLNLPPGPPQRWAQRGRAGVLAAWAVQAVLILVPTLLVVRLLSGQWLPSYGPLVVLAVGVGVQAVCRSVNLRASASEAGG